MVVFESYLELSLSWAAEAMVGEGTLDSLGAGDGWEDVADTKHASVLTLVVCSYSGKALAHYVRSRLLERTTYNWA